MKPHYPPLVLAAILAFLGSALACASACASSMLPSPCLRASGSTPRKSSRP